MICVFSYSSFNVVFVGGSVSFLSYNVTKKSRSSTPSGFKLWT